MITQSMKNICQAVAQPIYTCYRCGIPGHWIQNCPTNYNKWGMKRSTGIPRTFMVPVDGPEHKGVLLTGSGEYAVPYVQYLAHKEEKIETPSLVIKSVTEVPKILIGNRGRQGLPIPSIQVSDRSPGSTYRQSNITKNPVPIRGHGHAEYNARRDPLLRHKEYDVPHEEVPLLRHQEYDVTLHENDSSIQEHYKEYDVPLQEEGPTVRHQENDVPLQEKDSLLQPQEHFHQFNMPPHEEVPLYQEYNAPPFEKDYFLQHREHYQSPENQSSMHPPISDTVYGPPVPSQYPYMLTTSQMFPLQPQPPEDFSINNSQLPLPGVELSHPISTNDVSVLKTLPYQSEDAATNQEEKNGSTLLDKLQRKLDKLIRKYAKDRVNRSRSRSIERHDSHSLSQSRSNSSSIRAVSKSPTRTSHSKYHQQDRLRLFSPSRSISVSRERSHSRPRNESGDKHQSDSSENIRSRDPDQQENSRLYSPSRSTEGSYSRYRTRTRSKSHSRSRNELGDRHQSGSSENIRSPYHRTHSRTFSSQHFHASSHRSKPFKSKHKYNHY